MGASPNLGALLSLYVAIVKEDGDAALGLIATVPRQLDVNSSLRRSSRQPCQQILKPCPPTSHSPSSHLSC